jgi:hypothetical protein
MNMSVMDGCLVAEHLGYGCTGIKSAIEASNLGVRNIELFIIKNNLLHYIRIFAYNNKILS